MESQSGLLGGDANEQGWPEPYIYTVYDRTFGDFPAKNTVCKPYIYGSGQPDMCCIQLAAVNLGLVQAMMFGLSKSVAASPATGVSLSEACFLMWG